MGTPATIRARNAAWGPLLSPSNGRLRPRPSVAGQPVLVPLSIAALPVERFSTGTVPPMNAGGCKPKVLVPANCSVTILAATETKQESLVTKLTAPASELMIKEPQFNPVWLGAKIVLRISRTMLVVPSVRSAPKLLKAVALRQNVLFTKRNSGAGGVPKPAVKNIAPAPRPRF